MRKIRPLLGTLLLAALAAGLVVLVGSPATAQTSTLSLTKTDSPDPVNVGQDLTYTLTVTNGGPNTATSVTVTDNLPANTTFVSAANCTYNAASHTVTCNVGDLANGTSAQRQIVVKPTAAGTISNTARVSSNTADTNDANNSATVTTTVNAADLSITKSDNPDPVLVNGNFSYTLSVSNAQGAAAADDVRITDTLPAGVTLNGQLPDNCSSTGTDPLTVTCDLDTVAPGQTVSRTIDVRAPGTPGTLENRARVTSPTDPTPNDSNVEQTTVVAEANLSITKTDSEDPVLVNGNFSYTLSVNNAQGAGTATDVTVRDTLPEGVTLNGSLPTDCSSTAGTDGRITVTCNLGTINAGQSVSRTINVSAGGPPRTLSNTATVSSPRDRTDSSDTKETTVIPAADLSLAKTDSPDAVTFGNNLTYTLTATNSGPSAATGVVIRDTLPANAQFVSASGGCTESGGVVTCNVGNLANGASATREIVVHPTTPGTLNNEATVSSDTADPNEGNNAATATTQVNAADLSIDKRDSEDRVSAGENFAYILEVTNNGAADATNVRVTDELPAGVGFVSAPDCTYDAPSHTVTCDLNTVNAGDPPVERRITVTAPDGPVTLSNTARVTSPNDPTDSGDTEQTVVVASSDLSIAKSAPATVTDGVVDEDSFAYRIEVTNNGPSNAEGVVVADQLPEGVEFVEFISAPNGCTNDAGTVRCAFATLASGETVVVEIRVQAKTPGEKNNTATVESSTDDPNTQNNSDTATTQVNAASSSADLAIDKADSPDPVEVGQELTYTLTVGNGGPNAATGVTVTDDLPNSVIYNDAASSPGCSLVDATENVVECSPVSLAASGEGATKKFTIVVTPQAGAVPSITNTASVEGNEFDPDEANNNARRSRRETLPGEALGGGTHAGVAVEV